MAGIQTKRVYEPAKSQDGLRILVDRIWPRGMTKEQARAGLWLKELAPSTALRKWFAHEPARWDGFKRRYYAELDANPQAVEQLVTLAQKGKITLLFSARDTECNQAVALKEYLLARFH